MVHRHLNSEQWALERGDLPDWRALFAAARTDRELARRILRVARGHDIAGSSVLAETLVRRLCPDIEATPVA